MQVLQCLLLLLCTALLSWSNTVSPDEACLLQLRRCSRRHEPLQPQLWHFRRTLPAPDWLAFTYLHFIALREPLQKPWHHFQHTSCLRPIPCKLVQGLTPAACRDLAGMATSARQPGPTGA